MPTFRYITTEELEQALREYGMHDGRDIKEIISEVDSDNVSNIYIYIYPFHFQSKNQSKFIINQ